MASNATANKFERNISIYNATNNFMNNNCMI